MVSIDVLVLAIAWPYLGVIIEDYRMTNSGTLYMKISVPAASYKYYNGIQLAGNELIKRAIDMYNYTSSFSAYFEHNIREEMWTEDKAKAALKQAAEYLSERM